MPRHKAITPNRHIHTTIPPDLGLKMDLFLFSGAENRVPQGAVQELFVRLLRQFFEEKEFDLAPFIPGCQPGTQIIRGQVSVLSNLITHLKGKETQ